MPPDLSIVILSWNVAELLSACLRSLPGAARDWWRRCEVLVVDNESSDGTVERVRREFPEARLLVMPSNRGFGSGNNAGIRASRGKFIFLLNPDTVAHANSIATLASYLEAHPTTGIVGPRLLNPDGTLQPSRRRFPNATTAVIESTPLQKWTADLPLLRKYYMLDRSDDETQEVEWLSGAALMCRREALEQVGLFDPGYFMFSEEVDLCRRVYNAGWSVAYIPQAVVTHYGGQSTGQDVLARHIHFNTSKARYFRIHEGKIVGRAVRLYLLGTYVGMAISEGAKWLAAHKRPLRAARLRMYGRVLRSGLREQKPKATRGDVLLVTGEHPPAHGGVGDYTCRLNLALREQNIRARVLTNPQKVPGDGRRAGHANEASEHIQPGMVGLSPLVAPRITLASILRALQGTRARIAHIQYQTSAYGMRPTINMLPLLLRWKRHVATVVTFHDLLVPYLFPKAGHAREWANRLLARTVSAAIATNPADAARLRSWGVKRVELIPIGSNIPNDPPESYNRELWRAERGVKEGATLLAYFGFLNSTKGVGDLLKAVSILRRNIDVKLMMVGGGVGSSDPTNRSTASKLDSLARQLGVADSLIWTGYLAPRELSAALISADMAVLPYADGASFRRGSLLAVLEHGLPLITTYPKQPVGEHSSLRNLPFMGAWPQLMSGENAVLVQPGDLEGLTAAIQQVASDAELRTKLAAGAQTLASFFKWDRIAEMHARLYEELVPPQNNS